MSRLNRLESLIELLKKDRKSQMNQQYWQNERNITEHVAIYGIEDLPETTRFFPLEIRR